MSCQLGRVNSSFWVFVVHIVEINRDYFSVELQFLRFFYREAIGFDNWNHDYYLLGKNCQFITLASAN